jgi:hypothetical protein
LKAGVWNFDLKAYIVRLGASILPAKERLWDRGRTCKSPTLRGASAEKSVQRQAALEKSTGGLPAKDFERMPGIPARATKTTV